MYKTSCLGQELVPKKQNIWLVSLSQFSDSSCHHVTSGFLLCMFVFVSGSALNCEHCHVHTLKARKFFAFVLFFEKINDRQSITLGIPRFRKFESCTQCPRESALKKQTLLTAPTCLTKCSRQHRRQGLN